jgi:hypothetical protein
LTQLQNAGSSPADGSPSDTASARIIELPRAGVTQAEVDTFASDVDALTTNITNVVVASDMTVKRTLLGLFARGARAP